MPGIPRPSDSTDAAAGTAAEVADLLHAVARKVRRRANADLGPLGLTAGPARALRALGRAGGPVRMGVVAERLGIAPRSATDAVDHLVGRGLAERAPDPDDGRAVVVGLTEEGRRLLRRIDEGRHRALADLASDLSPADLARLRDLLRRLAD